MTALRSGQRSWGYFAGLATVAAAALFMSPLTSGLSGGGVAVASVLLLSVVLTAVLWGVGPGVVAAIVSSLCLEVLFFYSDQEMMSDKLIGFAAFLLTSLLVGRLSARARRSTQQAENLRVAFDHASELEAAKRNEQFKSLLLDTVTHDFRTPLTSIKAAATTLLERGGSVSSNVNLLSQRLLHTIVHESDRLDQFIEGMIEMAKASSAVGPTGLSAPSAPLEEIFAAALSRAEDLLQQHHITVTCEDDLYVRGSPRAISQVLFSLLENAAKYSSPNTTISVSAAWQGSDFIGVAVEDEGPGVPHQLREAIFEKFVRGSGPGARAADDQGLGIGLAIARGIVSAHGGTIRVEDRPDARRGARFVFTLPAKRRAETAQTKGAPAG